jgi:hypothetical protein
MATNNVINSNNVSNLVPKDINTTLSAVQKPTSFGDQLVDASKDKLKVVTSGIKGKLKKDINALIKKRINLDNKHAERLQKLDQELKEGYLTQELYDVFVNIEEKNYDAARATLDKEQKDLEKKLQDSLKDPFKKRKDKARKRKDKLKNREKKSKQEKQKANKERKQALFKSVKKTITPVLILLLTEKIVKAAGQIGRLQRLVDETNAIILAADTPEKINQAKVARDSAINEINNVENTMNDISKQLEKIQKIVAVFGLIVSALSLIPFPAPPKVPTTIEKLSKIVSGLSYALGASTPVLQRIINNLEDLKRQLREINALLDGKTADTFSGNQLNNLLAIINEQDKQFPDYKGFKFAIKEEQNPQFVVKGNKRHYAVAIDTLGVEAIKSEYSFTLDPQVLVDQLKLVIDQRNLQG